MGTIAHRCRSRRGMTPRNGETYGQQRIRSTTPFAFAPPTTPTAPNLPRHEGHATHIDETSARQLREVVRARSQCQAPEPSCSRRARLAQRRVVARKAWRRAGTGQRHLHTQESLPWDGCDGFSGRTASLETAWSIHFLIICF